MSFAFYIYTTIIMGVALVTSAVALVVWLMTHRRDSLVAAAGFLLYMLDMSVIFFDEYTRSNMTTPLPLASRCSTPCCAACSVLPSMLALCCGCLRACAKGRRRACSDLLSCRFQSCNWCWCLAAVLPERCSSISFGSRVTWAM